jgi:hypothetical protein
MSQIPSTGRNGQNINHLGVKQNEKNHALLFGGDVDQFVSAKNERRGG